MPPWFLSFLSIGGSLDQNKFRCSWYAMFVFVSLFTWNGVSNAGNFKHCWKAENRLTEYNYCTKAEPELLKSKCPGINLHDDEILSDFLHCGGATMCWHKAKFPKTDGSNVEMSLMIPTFILESSHNLQLTDDQIASAKGSGTKLLLGNEVCSPLQKALDAFMPEAIKALR